MFPYFCFLYVVIFWTILICGSSLAHLWLKKPSLTERKENNSGRLDNGSTRVSWERVDSVVLQAHWLRKSWWAIAVFASLMPFTYTMLLCHVFLLVSNYSIQHFLFPVFPFPPDQSPYLACFQTKDSLGWKTLVNPNEMITRLAVNDGECRISWRNSVIKQHSCT